MHKEMGGAGNIKKLARQSSEKWVGLTIIITNVQLPNKEMNVIETTCICK